MLSLSKKVLILVTVPVFFEVGLVGWISSLVSRVEDARARAAHARELDAGFNAIMVLTLRRLSHNISRRASGNPNLGKTPTEYACTAQMLAKLDSLQASLKSPEEKQKWRQLTDLVSRVDANLGEASRVYDAGDDTEAATIWVSMQRDIDKVFTLSSSISNEQDLAQEQSLSEYVKYDSELKNVLNFSVLASSILAFSLAIFFNQSTTNRLAKLVANTNSLAAGKPPTETVSGQDELSQIDQTYHSMYSDLSALRQKERAILDNASEVICSLSKDLKIENINRAAYSLWGYQVEDLLGMRVLNLVTADERENLQKALADALKGPTGKRLETAVLRSDGTTADTSWAATWSESEESYYCVISDITARKQLDKMKQEFVAMISHDLRTPLNSTLASLELVSSPHFQIDDEVRQHIVKAEKNLNLTLSLINQLLEMERLEAGVLNLQYDAITTREVIQKALNAVSAIAAAKKVNISTPTTNLDLVADGERLVQVLINLLGNALKFSPDGSKIRIREERRGERVRINVIDEGRGIPAGQLSAVFERFGQVSPGDAAEKAGSGLGLAICKAIVEAHKGTIGVTSEVGIGSTFWFEIPTERP